MTDRGPASLRHQQRRWLRVDAARWIRPDAAKFCKPGTDPADVYSALAAQRDLRRQAFDREIDAAIARERAVLDGLRAELEEINAQMRRRRAHADRAFDDTGTKYSPS